MSIATEERYVRNPKNWIIFDGKSLADFKLYCSGDKTFSAPQRNVDLITIPGRNGSLVRDKGTFANITVEYSCWIPSNFRGNVEALRNYLLSKAGYKRLEDTYDPDTFRLAVFQGPLDVSAYYSSTFGSFTLQFQARPERFLKSGETAIALTIGDNEIENPTLFESKPIIRLTDLTSLPFTITDGTYELTVRDTIGDPISDLIIDTENLNAYGHKVSDGSISNCNNMITANVKDKWLGLVPGNNTVTVSRNQLYPQSVSGLSIIPRWWII